MNIIFLILTFITSFATMSYAMIMASIISDFTGQEIYSQCLTMGPYLLGLGFGSILGDKIKKNETLSAVWKFEWLSVILLPLMPLIHLGFIFVYLHLSPVGTSLESKSSLKIILSLTSVMSLFIGFLGGAQLPLIIREVESKLKAEIVLAVNYCGPLFAGPFIILCNGYSLPASVQIGIIALLQIVGLILIIATSQNRLKRLTLLGIPLINIIFLTKYYPDMEYITIKASYVGTKMKPGDLNSIGTVVNTIEQYGNLERIRTPYQVIDFLSTPAFPEIASPANFTLYLNRKTQFDFFGIDIYHQSMLFAGLNLLQYHPKNVLILGAGDGLLLKELKHIQGIKNITMIELDPGMIQWAATNPVMSDLNEHSLTLEDPRVKIHINDAVTFLRKHPKNVKYDLIFVDFPFPNGYELSKLYSVEFYQLLKQVAHPKSIALIDMPISYNKDEMIEKDTRTILKTLKASGFNSRLGFGPFASFLATTLEVRKLEFDYTKFPDHLALSARLNLVEIIDENQLSSGEEEVPINSMFWPRGI